MSLTEVEHKKFTYVLIPACMDDPVDERQYEGKEEGFQQALKEHFSREQLLQREKEKFKDDLSQKAKGKLTDDQLSALAGAEHSYQIVPLELPSSANGFLATNAYIDSIGRVKELPRNARASRVCSTDIRGDCFLSKTFDDEEEFRRVNLTKADYQQLLEHPPEAKGRWSETTALNQLFAQQQQEAGKGTAAAAAVSAADKAPSVRRCRNCGERERTEETDGKVETVCLCLLRYALNRLLLLFLAVDVSSAVCCWWCMASS